MGKYYDGPCVVTDKDGALACLTRYDHDFLDDLKWKIPSSDRAWDKPHWLIHPKHADLLAKLIKKHYDETPTIPVIKSKPKLQTGTIKVKYLGTSKEKNDWHSFGMDYVTSAWDILIHEDVLQAFFSGSTVKRTGDPSTQTLFGLLGVSKTATDDEIRKGFRRMARQWHPDVCKEPNAEERFKQINDAYQTLSDPKLRSRYIFGLKETASAQVDTKFKTGYDYQPDLRCGILHCDYRVFLGRRIVEEIKKWDDITNNKGQILVTSWRMGDTSPTEIWVNPEFFESWNGPYRG